MAAAALAALVPGAAPAMLAITALGAIFGANSSKKSAKKAENYFQLSEQSLSNDLAFRIKTLQEAQKIYNPLEEQLLGKATSDEPLGYDILSGQMQQQYADALRRIGEQGNIGVGGLAGGAARQSEFGLATGLGNAYAQGQMNKLNLGTSLLGQNPVYGLGRDVFAGNQNMSNFYGQQANMYTQLAGQGSNAIGQSLQGLTYGLGQYYQGQGRV